MPTRERPADRARRLARRTLGEVADELRHARVTMGRSQREVALAAGIPRSRYSRIERLEVAPAVEEIWVAAAVLGLDARLGLYPGGSPVHDHVQLALLEAFYARLHGTVGWRTEVGLPIEGDRRAWDAVAIAPDGWTGIEAISRMGAVDAVVRRANLKLRDDPRVGRIVLLVNDTIRNREALRHAAAAIRAEFPLDTREVLAALGAGRTPAHSGAQRRCPPPRALTADMRRPCEPETRRRRPRSSTGRPQRGKTRGRAGRARSQVGGKPCWCRAARPIP
ncbi:MAG: helix-turn-helix transcriptional regulator [Chloroflexota bacterium]